MHGIETGFTGYLCLMEGCSTQTCRYVAKQALLRVVSAVSVLPLAWRALGMPHSSGTKGQSTRPSLKALCSHSSACHCRGLAVLGRPVCSTLGTGSIFHCTGHWHHCNQWGGSGLVFIARIYPQGGLGNTLCKEHGKEDTHGYFILTPTSKTRCTIKTQPSSAVKCSDVFGKIRILTPATSFTILSGKDKNQK